MKGPIPDLSKPSPFRVLLRERREKSIAEGNALVAEYLPKSQQGARDYLPESKPVEMAETEADSDLRSWMRKWDDSVQYAEIERQLG